MILNDAISIFFGRKQVSKLAIGKTVFWQKGAYLKITPTNIWLMKLNDYQADVEIFSNVKWDVK